mmetsp:Transcript_465/g.865  ORF Transcript_465/g.865 Transcript_465/m.865 type:complete len:111 (+) Transcript_465:365-697(+)
MVFEAHHSHDDNMLRACRDTNIILEIKRRVCERFDITDMNEIGQFLNVRVTRTQNCLKLDQTVFIKKILVKYVDFLGVQGTRRGDTHYIVMSWIGSKWEWNMCIRLKSRN